jgi:hypothetical protein
MHTRNDQTRKLSAFCVNVWAMHFRSMHGAAGYPHGERHAAGFHPLLVQNIPHLADFISIRPEIKRSKKFQYSGIRFVISIPNEDTIQF